MAFGRRKRNKGGWVIISGRRRFSEIFYDYKVLFIVLGVALFSAALTAYLYLAGPLAVSRYKSRGLAAISAGDFDTAAAALEKSDGLSFTRRPDILYPLGVVYFAQERYDDAIMVFDGIINTIGGSVPYRALPPGTAEGISTSGGGQSDISGGASVDAEGGLAALAANDSFGNGVPISAQVHAEFVERPYVPIEAYLDAPTLPRICYFLSEAYAYAGAPDAAYDAAYYGFVTTGDVDLLTLAETMLVNPPASLTSSGVYNGRFVFRFEPVPEGIRTYYNWDVNPDSDGAAAEYPYFGSAADFYSQDGMEVDFGVHSISAINVNRYGLISPEAHFMFTVLDAAGNDNGNIINGAIAVERGEEVYFFNGDGIYVETAGAALRKITEGANIRCLNLLGEWLYFVRMDDFHTGIYKIRVDGTGLSRLSDAAAEYLQTAGDKLYYTTRDGLCSMPPDGGEAELIVEGAVFCVNYHDGMLYFIMELPNGDVDDAGPVFSYEIDGGALKQLIYGPATFLQVSGDMIYYALESEAGIATALSPDGPVARIAMLDGSPAGQVARPAGLSGAGGGAGGAGGAGGVAAGSDANSAAAGNGTSRYISGPINSFHVDGDNLYYYDVLSGSIVSVDVAGSGTGGGTGSAGSGQGRGLSADLFTNTSYVDSINVAAGMLYGRMSGGDTGYSYFRLDMAQRAGGQAIVDDEVYTSSNTGSVVQYGSKLYYIERDASGEQNIYAINTSVNVNEPVAVALHLENAGMDFGGSGGAPGNNPSGGSGAGSAQSTEQGTQNTTQSPQDNTQNAPNDGQNTSNGGQNASIGGQNAPNDASDNEPVSALQGSAGAVGSERSDAVIYGFSPVGGAILYGIPADEQIIYITDRLIITNDYIYARLYTVPEIEVYSAPGVVNAPWAVVHGSARYHKFMELRAQAGAGSGAGSAGEDGDGGAQSDSAEWRPGAVGEADDGTAGAAADGTANGAPSGTDTGESSADGVSPGGETSDVEPGEAGGELREGAGEDNGESGAADNGAGGAGGTSGSAGGGADAEIPENVVFPEVLADNGMHMWHGMSQFRQFDDRLYFSSQAGFFSTDIGFMTATFVNGDGPEIGEDFLVSGDKAFFRRSIVSGESGLYMLDLKSGQQRRIFGGNAAGFDVSANFIYFTDADEGAMYMFDTDSDAPAVRMFEDGGLTGDIVICREGGGLVVRSPENGFALYVMDSDSFNVRKITEGGADVLAYYRDFIYYEAWDMPGTFIRLDVKRAGADGARSADSTNGANDTNVANGANNGTNGANGANNGTNNDGNADAPDSENDADDASASG